MRLRLVQLKNKMGVPVAWSRIGYSWKSKIRWSIAIVDIKDNGSYSREQQRYAIPVDY
jgi:hypothetical protein